MQCGYPIHTAVLIYPQRVTTTLQKRDNWLKTKGLDIQVVSSLPEQVPQLQWFPNCNEISENIICYQQDTSRKFLSLKDRLLERSDNDYQGHWTLAKQPLSWQEYYYPLLHHCAVTNPPTKYNEARWRTLHMSGCFSPRSRELPQSNLKSHSVAGLDRVHES